MVCTSVEYAVEECGVLSSSEQARGQRAASSSEREEGGEGGAAQSSRLLAARLRLLTARHGVLRVACCVTFRIMHRSFKWRCTVHTAQEGCVSSREGRARQRQSSRQPARNHEPRDA